MTIKIVTSPERSQLMKRVRQARTDIEEAVAGILKRLGIRYCRHPMKLPGRPDFANIKRNWVLFVNGCYWHFHGCHLSKVPSTNQRFWEKKLLDNQARDQRKILELQGMGFRVETIWECELKKDRLAEDKIHSLVSPSPGLPQSTDSVEVSFVSTAKANEVTRVVSVSGKIVSKDSFYFGTEMARRMQSAEDSWDQAYLRSAIPPNGKRKGQSIRIADLFCGCGGLSLGVKEAARALRVPFASVLAWDKNREALDVYQRNFSPISTLEADIACVLRPRGSAFSSEEHKIARMAPDMDLLLAGPPCQGHSDLNNHTRRIDDRNRLYASVVRFAELCFPESIVIENVPAVMHSKDGVYPLVIRQLIELGYKVTPITARLWEIGVPQLRKRHVLFATTRKEINLPSILEAHSTDRTRTLRWAIEDCMEIQDDSTFDTAGILSDENKKRAAFLHRHGLFDLPNTLRPHCHKNGGHSYKSMYGRLHWEKPAQTITTGFGSPGQGRYFHPTQLRTLTPHEAARLQFFPDSFDFSSVKTRRALAMMVGNAVPMRLTFFLALHLFAYKVNEP